MNNARFGYNTKKYRNKTQSKKNNSDYVSRCLERRIVHGRHSVLVDKIVLVSTFPILDEDMNYFHKQLHHALLEIWDMNSIAEHAPE